MHQAHLSTTVMLIWCVCRPVDKDSGAKPHMLGKCYHMEASILQMFLSFIYLE